MNSSPDRMVGRLIFAIGSVSYLGLCASLTVSDILLGSQKWYWAWEMASVLSDGLLYPFPNNLFPLLYGITDNRPAALVIVGGLNLLFFGLAGIFVRRKKERKTLPYMAIGYAAFSGLSYVGANYLFFSIYFMRPGP